MITSNQCIGNIYGYLRELVSEIGYFRQSMTENHFFRADIDEEQGEFYEALKNKVRYPAFVAESFGNTYTKTEKGIFKERMMAFSIVEGTRTDNDYNELDTINDRVEPIGDEIMRRLIDACREARCPIEIDETEATQIRNTQERYAVMRWSFTMRSFWYE